MKQPHSRGTLKCYLYLLSALTYGKRTHIPNAWLRSFVWVTSQKSVLFWFHSKQCHQWEHNIAISKWSSQDMASLCLNSLPVPPTSLSSSSSSSSLLLHNNNNNNNNLSPLKPIVVSGDPPTFVSAPGRRILAGLVLLFQLCFVASIWFWMCLAKHWIVLLLLLLWNKTKKCKRFWWIVCS